MNVKIEQSKSKGTVYIEIDEVLEAEMTYSIASSSLIIIDHTEVNDSLKGQGAGKKMLMALIEKARNENIKIIPLCPYAKSVFDKDVSIRDVLK